MYLKITVAVVTHWWLWDQQAVILQSHPTWNLLTTNLFRNYLS